jgi:hypothetical protein
MRFVSTSFQQSSSFYARTSGSFSGSLISSSFFIATTTDLGGFDANFGTKKVTYIIPSGSTGGNSDVKALLISASGINPRVGIGVDNPLKAFDFKEIRDDNRGGELLIRGSRITKGAEVNDEAGRINFIIDSSSYNKVETSGSVAEIVAVVDQVDETGVLGAFSFRTSAGKKEEPTEILKLNSPGYTSTVLQLTGSADFGTNVNIVGDLTIGGKINSFITASSGISASGDIETSGDVIATNFVVSENGNLKTVGSGEYVNLQTNQIALGFGSSWSAYFKKAEGFIFNDLNTGPVGTALVRDFRVKGLNDSNLLFASGGDATVGIGTDTPTEKLTVSGNIAVTGTVDGVDIATLKGDFDTLEGKALVSGSYVASVNGQTGAAVLNADDIGTTGTTNKFTTQADITKLSNLNISGAGDFVNNEFIVAVGTNAVTSSDALAVDSSGNLGIGTNSPEVRLHMRGEDAQTSQILMEQYNDTADAPDIRTRRFRGTPASPSDVQTGDYLFRINVEGRDGGSNVTYGSMQFDVDGTDQDALNWRIQTRDTAGTLADRITIDSAGDLDVAGQLSINGFSDVSASLAAAVAGGDNLGNHTATQNLNMGTYAITNVGNVDGVDVSTLKSDFDTLESKTLVSGSSQIDLGSATGTATNASTASYIAGSNVDGTVAFSSLATTAINATNASNVDISNVSGNTEYGLVFRDGNGDGNQALYADNEVDQPSYNPSTNTITTPIISASSALYVDGNITVTGTVDGADIATLNNNFTALKTKTLVSESAQIDLGSATGTATNATNATNVNIGNADGSSTYFLLGSLSTGNQPLKRLITYNDSTDTLSTTNITVTSNVSASGIITTDDYRFGDRKFATGTPSDSAGISFGNNGEANLLLTHISASGNISSSGRLLGNDLTIANNASINGVLSIPGFSDVSASLAAAVAGGDNLGNHTATQDLDMDGNNITMNAGEISGATDIEANAVKIGNGSTGTPSLAFTNDTNTGIYSVAPDTLGITTGGTNRLTVGSSGTTLNHSSGTGAALTVTNTYSSTNPDGAIAIKGVGCAATGVPGSQTKAYGGYFLAGDTNTANPDTIALYAQGHEDGAPNSYAAIFSGSAGGVVGINTMEPTVELDVDGDGKFSGTLEIGGISDVSASIAAAGGGSPTTYRVQLQSMGFYSQNSLRYLTFNTTGETTGFNYISIIPAPASGRLISITAWPQSSAGSTTMGFHVNSNATAASTDTQTLTAGSPAQFTFSSGNTFSALDELSFSINPTNNPNGLSFSIILEYDY